MGHGIRTQPGRLRAGREPSVSLMVSPFLAVWDMILGHLTDISAQVANPVFTLSVKGRLLVVRPLSLRLKGWQFGAVGGEEVVDDVRAVVVGDGANSGHAGEGEWADELAQCQFEVEVVEFGSGFVAVQ